MNLSFSNPAVVRRFTILMAKGRETEKQRGLSAGADDFVTKPFSTRDVVERVEKFLSTGRQVT